VQRLLRISPEWEGMALSLTVELMDMIYPFTWGLERRARHGRHPAPSARFMSFTRGDALVRTVLPARAMDRPWRAGLLASGSSPDAPPSRAFAQWQLGASAIRSQLREQHRSCGRSRAPTSLLFPLPGTRHAGALIGAWAATQASRTLARATTDGTERPSGSLDWIKAVFP